MPLKRKIEDRSITALQSVIDAHPTMEGYINKRDKELAWDGYIRLYLNDDADGDKANFDDDISIQIKGHVDKERKYMDRERVTVSVNLEDLTIYYRKLGCLYFVMYMNEDGTDVEIFYASLYPSKIKGYLEVAKMRGNKSSISLPFLKLEKNCRDLYLLCKQFSFEVKKQGSGEGQIVPRSISGNQLKFVKKITATTIGGDTPYDLMKKINTGDAVLYGTIDDSEIQYPIQMTQMVTSVKQIVEMPVSIGDTQYYSFFVTETTVTAPDVKNYVKDSIKTVKLSPNLTLTLKKTDINFKFQYVTDLMQLKKDAEFLLDLIDKKEMIIFGAKIPMQKPGISDELLNQLKDIVEVGQILEDIGCNILIPFKELTDEDKAQIDLLCNIREGKIHFNTDNNIFLYTWMFRGKNWPIIVDVSGEVKLYGYLFNTSLVFTIDNLGGEKIAKHMPDDAYIVPNFLRMEPDLLSSLYWYDYESMYEQIDRSVINDETADELNLLALNLITAYDLCDNEKLLDVADALLDKLIKVFPDGIHYLVN